MAIMIVVLSALTLLGLSLGSFVNALVWRMHEQARSKKNRQDPKLSIIHARSICPNCKHELGVLDLIPVVSWLWLRRKCRYCHKPISWQYPIVEAGTALLFVISYIHWPYAFNGEGTLLFIIWLITIVGFMALIVYDLRWMILPNKIVGFLFVVACLQVVVKLVASSERFEAFLAAFWGVLVIAGLFYVLFRFSDGRWIGGGDVKLGVVLGLIVGGILNTILLIFLACLLGSLVGIFIVLLEKKDLKTKIPFGPFLIVATIFVYLFGTAVITWYKTRFLYF